MREGELFCWGFHFADSRTMDSSLCIIQHCSAWEYWFLKSVQCRKEWMMLLSTDTHTQRCTSTEPCPGCVNKYTVSCIRHSCPVWLNPRPMRPHYPLGDATINIPTNRAYEGILYMNFLWRRASRAFLQHTRPPDKDCVHQMRGFGLHKLLLRLRTLCSTNKQTTPPTP